MFSGDNIGDKENMSAERSFVPIAANKPPSSRKSDGEPRDPGIEANIKYTIDNLQSEIAKILAHHPEIKQHVNVSVLTNSSNISASSLSAFRKQVEAAAQMAREADAAEDNGESLLKSIIGLFESDKPGKKAKMPLVPHAHPHNSHHSHNNIPLAELGILQPLKAKTIVDMAGESVRHNTLA